MSEAPRLDPQQQLALASKARQEGRLADARILLEQMLSANRTFGPGWNLLGLLQLETGQAAAAEESLKQASAVDPQAAMPLFNLSRAQRALGAFDRELDSINRALGRDPFLLPAILAKGEVLLTLDREAEALEIYRLLFAGLPGDRTFPEPLQSQLNAARTLLDRQGQQRFDHYEAAVASVAARYPGDDLRRARAFAEQRAGRREVFQQRPTDGHFPYLPALEFFDRDLFPWFSDLEGETSAIRSELLSLWADDDPHFRPYVTYGEGTPLGDWAELNWSPRWSAWFLWEDGRRNEENCARCPRTAAAIERLPLLDVPGKSPTVMFSVLQPQTRIPPHTGSTNTRCTIHLPLVVPPGCGFRVGAETREWAEGTCWAFDDTIEHEAWNNSDQARGILILDGWNPLLTEAERDVVRSFG